MMVGLDLRDEVLEFRTTEKVILDSSFHLGVENNKAERLGYSKKQNGMSFP